VIKGEIYEQLYTLKGISCVTESFSTISDSILNIKNKSETVKELIFFKTMKIHIMVFLGCDIVQSGYQGFRGTHCLHNSEDGRSHGVNPEHQNTTSESIHSESVHTVVLLDS
jgi:hypothetical protein